MHPNPFMDKVGIEVVGQGDIGNRGVSLRTLGDDLGLEGLGIGTAFLWHGRPLKKARNGVHLNLSGHHRLKRWHQEGVLPGRLRKYFDAHGLRTPDPQSGKIYLLDTHGSVVYLTFREHYFLYGLIIAGIVFFLLSIVFYFVGRKRP